MSLKFTRQFDQMDCGPACIRMVASAYGKEYPLSYLRTLAHLTREGVSVAGIRDALRQIGMESATFEMTLDQLERRCPKPAILHWDQNHFVVLYKVKRNRLNRKRTFCIANPAYGKHAYSEEEMHHSWLNGEKGIVVAIEPTEEFFTRKPVKEKHSFVKFARKYVWPYKWQMATLALSMLAGIGFSLVTPFITQHLVDDGIMLKDMGIIVNLMLAQLALFLGSFGMNLMTSWVSLYMSTRINIHILSDYLTKLLRLPMTFFETKSIGDYNQRIGDHARLQGFVTQATLETAFSLVSSIVLLSIIAWFSLKIFLLYVALTAVSIGWMTYFFQKRKALDYEQFRISAENQNKLYELMSGIVDIKLNGYEQCKIDEWQEMQERQYRMSKKSLKLGQIQSTGYMAIGQLRNILITFWIASDVVGGLLTLGMMMSISNIIGQVNGPLGSLLGFLQQFQDAKISLERSEEVHLCENEDNDTLLQADRNRALDLELRHVTFNYTGNIGRPALKDITFTIPAGKTTAIVGGKRQRQDDAHEASAEILRAHAGQHPPGRQRAQRIFGAFAARGLRHRDAGQLHLFGHHQAQYPHGRGVRRGANEEGHRAVMPEGIRRPPAARRGNEGGSRRHGHQRRREAAADDSPRHLQAAAIHDARRGHQFARCRERANHHGEHGTAFPRPHDGGHRPPAFDREERRPHHRIASRRNC